MMAVGRFITKNDRVVFIAGKSRVPKDPSKQKSEGMKIGSGMKSPQKQEFKKIFPYYSDKVKEVHRLTFEELPDSLQDDLLDLAYPSGMMAISREEWNEMNPQQRLEFLNGIFEYETTKENKKEPFEVIEIESISQKDLARMQREASGL